MLIYDCAENLEAVITVRTCNMSIEPGRVGGLTSKRSAFGGFETDMSKALAAKIFGRVQVTDNTRRLVSRLLFLYVIEASVTVSEESSRMQRMQRKMSLC